MRTEETLNGIIERLYANCGDLYTACRDMGVSVNFVQNWCKDDNEVAVRLDEAQRVGFMAIESVAIKRAVEGTEEDVWYKGAVVGSKTVHHDSLLVKVLEANSPKYAKGEAKNVVFKGPVQINNMPRAENYEQWVEMISITETSQREIASDRQALPLPAPGEGVTLDLPCVERKHNVFEGLPI